MITRIGRAGLAATLVWGTVAHAAGAGDRPARAAAPVPAIEAVAVGSRAAAIAIDGQTTEEVWRQARPVSEFLQRDPSEGAESSHRTEVRVAYDAAALYVAVEAFDPEPDRIAGLLTRRDESSPSDWVAILVDSYRDRRSAYEFAVNAAGVKYDRYWFNDTSNDMSWDAVWDVAAVRHEQGWRAEFRIPFSQLRFNPGAGGTFGFAVVRTIPHANETATWPLLPKSASGYVSSFGDLNGLAFAGGQKRLELSPYVVGQVATAPVAAGNPLVSSPDPQASAGLDVKYRVAPGLTLTGTVNPDFGQVEADPAVVNLGAFETFFAERRPFFVEGSGNFSFNVDCNDGQCTGLFYSRRIGRSPQRFVGAPAGGYADQPTNSTILGAAKLTGRVGAFSVGALAAVTAEERARLVGSPTAPVATSPVEPFAGYTVARASREFTNRSRLGFMITSTNRRLTDELRAIPGSAVTGGVDGDWRLAGGRYSVTGFWAGSTVRGDRAAIDRLQRSNVHSFQRPDAGHVSYDPTRTRLDGHAGSISVSKITGQRLRFSSNAGFKSPGFDINDLGFLTRADEISMSHWVQIRDDVPGRLVRSFRINFNQWAGWNFDGDNRFAGANVNAHWVFNSNWSAGTGVNVNRGGFADRLTRGGPGGFTTANVSQWGYVGTDNRKPVSAFLNVFWFADGRGSSHRDISPSVTWRPRASLLVSGGFGYNRGVIDTQWVQNLTDARGPHYIFGRLDQTTVSVTARVNYTISPTLSLQVFARPFVSAGAYGNFKELVDGRARRYEDRYAPFDYAGRPDFTFHSLRTTNVLRWEYRPGSVLFVVWQQGRELVTPAGEFQFGRNFGDTFSAPATNVFLVKVSRWLNF